MEVVFPIHLKIGKNHRFADHRFANGAVYHCIYHCGSTSNEPDDHSNDGGRLGVGDMPIRALFGVVSESDW